MVSDGLNKNEQMFQNGEESTKKEGNHQSRVSEKKVKDKLTRKWKIVALNNERMAKGTDSAEDDKDRY